MLNKSDLPPRITVEDIKDKSGHPIVSTSFVEHKGIDELEQLIKEMFLKAI